MVQVCREHAEDPASTLKQAEKLMASTIRKSKGKIFLLTPEKCSVLDVRVD